MTDSLSPGTPASDRDRERLLHVVRAANVGLWDWDLRTNRVHYSREWKAQIGYGDHEIGDGYEEWASRVHPEDLDRMVRAVRASIEHRAVYAHEFRFRHRDGSWRVVFTQASLETAEDGHPVRMLGSHIDLTELRSTEAAYRQTQEYLRLAYESAGLGTCEEATTSPVHDDSGAVVNYVAVKRDVTYERKVEEQLRQSQKLEAIGQLAGGIAHDFNNILSIIKGHAEMVEVIRDLPADVRTSVDEINRAADRAAGLTRQLLLFSRRQAPQLSTVDLNNVVVNMSRMLARILGEDIRVQFEYASQPLTINADAGMIDQVLLNLAVNSRDAMPDGGRLSVVLSECELDGSPAAVHSGAQPGPYACLTVSDSGEGIAPDVLPRVFEPFYTTKEVGKGTGLGLATVLGIVQQHGGWVDVQSEFGQGTVVRVYLPRADQELARPVERPAPTFMPRGEDTILLAEDDVALRRLVRTILMGLGYRVLEASSGRDAIAVWTQHQQDVRLLLTDLVMPDGMSGLELARLLLSHNPALKVIYSSGYSSDVAAQQVPLTEGVNFLGKPYSPQRLAETVHAALSGEALPPL